MEIRATLRASLIAQEGPHSMLRITNEPKNLQFDVNRMYNPEQFPKSFFRKSKVGINIR